LPEKLKLDGVQEEREELEEREVISPPRKSGTGIRVCHDGALCGERNYGHRATHG